MALERKVPDKAASDASIRRHLKLRGYTEYQMQSYLKGWKLLDKGI